jgi:hypothetical protein
MPSGDTHEMAMSKASKGQTWMQDTSVIKRTLRASLAANIKSLLDNAVRAEVIETGDSNPAWVHEHALEVVEWWASEQKMAKAAKAGK